ncbi:MAG: GNAT family N-acetyltransferase [Thermoplasmata archaeon]|nr:GNAT family N-acetyltransferase [Thermoplasmata archaeon]
MDSSTPRHAAPTVHLTRVGSPGEFDSGASSSLSPLFGPFLAHFVSETLRCRGEVWAARDGPRIVGLLTYNDIERVASVFTRDPAVAELLAASRHGVSIFSDFPMEPRPEVYGIYAVDLRETAESHRFAHPIRPVRALDRPGLQRLMMEVYGRVDEAWLSSGTPRTEKGFLVEVAGSIAGAGWVSVVNGRGRLHSLSVRPRYRSVGIGTDLWHARSIWCRAQGVSEILTEISDLNLPSRRIAERGGMRWVGQLYRSNQP